jgi:hypothetical protein
MGKLPTVEPDGQFRTRRWDGVVLGGALPGLIAAVRLGMTGARVLVLEEAAASHAFQGLREPFLVTGATGDGILGQCLRALGIPLIDRQRIGSDPLAYQVAFPDARLDVGDRQRTSEELVTWRFATREIADALMRGLAEAATAEREAMLKAPVVRAPRRMPMSSRRTAPNLLAASPPVTAPVRRYARGLPAEVSEAEPRLASLCAAQTRALSNLGTAAPSPEAAARLLGLSQEGSALFAGGEHWITALLRRRIESLYGEFRTLSDGFRLVSVANQPGVALDDSSEIWCGRVLLVNAPRSALAAIVEQDPTPEILAGPAPSCRRVALHFRTRRSALPEGMSKRVIAVSDPAQPMRGTNVVTLRVFPNARRDDTVDLVAAAVIPAGEPDLRAREAEIEASVARLMPFAEHTLERQRDPAPRWDTDHWLSDPAPGGGWPHAQEARVSGRPPTWLLDRAGVGGLGFEGDVLLGWRVGDAVAADLS